MKRTKKPLNLHHLPPLEIVELVLAQDLPLVRRMKVPQNLNRLPLLGVVELVLPIELRKNVHYKKYSTTQVRLFSHFFKKTNQKWKVENLPH